MLDEGGLGYPEGASGTPLDPVRAGSGIMERLNHRQRRGGRIAAGEDRRRLRRSRAIVAAIVGWMVIVITRHTTMFTTKHRHNCYPSTVADLKL